MTPLAVQDNVACLLQGQALLQALTPEQYTWQSPQGILTSGIGGHIRHDIDHYERFSSDWQTGRIDYDARQRDPRIESDPSYAAEKTAALIDQLLAVTTEDLLRPLQVKMDCGSHQNQWAFSGVLRELQFLLSHTIHHYALIAVLCKLQGIAIDAEFGVAPSTLLYEKTSNASCAP